MKGKLVLVDGNSLVNRAFYALPPFSTSRGEPTNAVYGFITMLLRFIDEEDPDYIGVAFDLRAPTFRHKRYESYKAQRPGMPDSLGLQIPVLKDVLHAFRIKIVEKEGYEADDILATIAVMAEQEGLETLVVTGDKDVLQLVSPKIRCVLTRKGISEVQIVGEEELMEDYGLRPEQVVDMKGLMGDSSDNVPGIPGIGEKTAIKLVREFGSIEGVLARVDEVKGQRLRDSLKKWADQALMSKALVSLVRDIPLDISLGDLKRRPYDEERLAEIFKRLEFRTLMEKMGLDAEPERNLEPPPVTVVTEEEAHLTLDGSVEVVSEFFERDLLGLGIFPAGGSGLYFPGSREEEILDVLEPLASDPRISKRGCNLKPLLVYLMSKGIQPRGFDFDATVAAYLLDPTRSSYKIEDLTREHLGCGLRSLKDIVGSGKTRVEFREVTPSRIASWMAEKAEALRQMRPRLLEALEEQGLIDLYNDVEIPLIPVLAAMEIHGVVVDPEQLDDMAKELESRIHDVESQVHRMAGVVFNINSTRQLGEVLFERLRLPAIKKTKTGYSTDAEVLEQLAVQNDVARMVLEYRQLVKLKSTYVEGLRNVISAETGRVHTTFHQTITATGRLSSSEPNLQNIPVRLDLGRRVRQVFRAPRGHLLLAGDYSQIELRVLAHLSGDPVLMEAFSRGEDIHTRTAAEVFGVEPSQVTPEMRGRAKAVNFGIVYGISDYGLARDIGVSKSEASQYIHGYFRRYSGVKSFIDGVISEARTRGYVSTILGRRRPLPDILSRNPAQRGFAERTAMNTPIQGSAADIIKLAMLRIHRELEDRGLGARMVLQVHDELIFEVPRNEMEEVEALVKTEMEGAYPLDVPLKVDLKKGPNWYDMN